MHDFRDFVEHYFSDVVPDFQTFKVVFHDFVVGHAQNRKKKRAAAPRAVFSRRAVLQKRHFAALYRKQHIFVSVVSERQVRIKLAHVRGLDFYEHSFHSARLQLENLALCDVVGIM